MTGLVEWDEEYATGISSIDDEHQELIASINCLHDAIERRVEKQQLLNTLNDIHDAIHEHFLHEEQLMKKFNYDQYEIHCQDHARLINDIRSMAEKLENDPDFDGAALTQRMVDWFSVHLRTHDARLYRLHALIVKDQKAGGIFSLMFGNISNAHSGDPDS